MMMFSPFISVYERLPSNRKDESIYLEEAPYALFEKSNVLSIMVEVARRDGFRKWMTDYLAMV